MDGLAALPDVPLHLGVTEAGMPPEGVIKTRIAFEQLLSRGIGDTVRVSLTVPFAEKWREIEAGNGILADIEAGRYRSVPDSWTAASTSLAVRAAAASRTRRSSSWRSRSK